MTGIIEKQKCLYVCVALLFLLPCMLRSEGAGTEPPSISIGSIVCATGNPWVTGWDNRLSAIRGMLISELSQKYQCHIQTRWQGLEVVTEQAVSDLAYIDRLKVPPSQIQTADLLLAGHFNESQKGAAVTGRVLCVNMREPEGRKPSAGGVEASNVFEIAGCMATAAARLASLQPLEKCMSSRQAVSRDSVIVVCTFAHLTDTGLREDEATVTRTELMLQQKGFTKLVNRKLINGILKEHNLAALYSSSQGGTSARMLAELVKADLLVMGQVAPWKNGLRLDVFLVHAASGAILAARTGYFRKAAELAETAAQCTASLVETPVTMPRVRLSSEQDRKREANLLLSQELYPDGVSVSEVSKVGFHSAMSSTEGAYTLVHDDRAFVYRIMSDLSGKLEVFERLWWHEDSTIRLLALRTSRLLDSALEPFTCSESTPNVLLMRAESLWIAAKYGESLALAKRQISERPADDNKRAYLVCAYCEQKLGHTAEALDYLAKAKVNNNVNDMAKRILADIQQKTSSQEIQQARALGPVAEYGKYRELFMTQAAKPTFDDLARYLELMRQVKGPKAALSTGDLEIKATVDWRGGCAPRWVMTRLLLHRAMCEAELGNKVEAARKCKDVIASINWKDSTFRYSPTDRMNSEATSLLARLEAEIGVVGELWKTAHQTRPLAGRYSLYVFPVGEEIKETMDNIRMILAGYYGVDLKIMPALSVPSGAVPKDNSYQYDWKRMFRGALEKAAIPDDALMVIFVTKHNVGRHVGCAGQLEEPQKDVFNPVFLSYSDCWYSDAPKAARVGANRFAIRIPQGMRSLYCKREKKAYPGGDITCTNFPCIFEESIKTPYSGADLRFAMCPTCQEDYKKADFDKIHNDLMDYLKKAGAKIVKAEKQR